MIPDIKKEHYTPLSIILGSLIISFSILLSSGVITVKGFKSGSLALNPPQSAQPNGVLGTQTTPAPTVASRPDASLGHLPIKGSDNAKVAVVEWADLRCPFCKRFFDDSETQLFKDYVETGQVKYAFRHFEFLGPASITAGNAAECANEQGKFWELHDYFYKNQPSESDTSIYTSDKLAPIANSLGMDANQFKSCLDANKYNNNLTADQSEGQQAGVNGTPTFVIGKLDPTGKRIIKGTLIEGAVPYTTIKSTIDQILQQ